MVNTTNPHYITQNATGTGLTQPVDTVDFPHSGLIKALNQMAAGNVVVKTGTDFDINQTGGNLVVAAGKILRNGKYAEVATKTFADSALTTTYAKGYHLLVVADGREGGETVNVLYMRPPTANLRVPEFKLGDTIVGLVEYSSSTSAGSRLIQYFTTNKESNSLSIAYANSNVYTEVGSIVGASGGTTLTSTGTLTLDADDTKLTASASGEPTLTLENTGAIASAANPPQIIFDRTGTSADGGKLGQIAFRGKESGGAVQDYVVIHGEATDHDHPSEDGRLRVTLARAGSTGTTASTSEFLRLSGGEGVIFNHEKIDNNFAIMGNTNDNLFFADAGTETIGIGITPIANAKLSIEGALALDEISAPTNTADYGQIYTNADNELHMIDGAGTDAIFLKGGLHTIWVPASAMYPNTTAGCSALTQVELSNGPELKCLDFDDGATESAQFTIAFPKSWNEGVVKFKAYWCSTATDTDGVSWGLSACGMNDNETINLAFGSQIVVDDANQGAANELMVSPLSADVTIAGTPAAEDLTFFQISRVHDDSNDTAAEDARLLGIKLYYTIDAGNDV